MFCRLLVYCAFSDVLFTVEIEHSDCQFEKKPGEKQTRQRADKKKINIYSKAKAVWNLHTPNLLSTLKLYFFISRKAMMQSEMVDSEVQELPGLVLDRPLGQIEHLLSLLSTGKVRL